MIGKSFGDTIEGDKIVLEAGHIDLTKKIVRAQGHRGDRAVGKIRAIAIIEKPFSYVKPTSLK